jgi:hypothetical protein
VGGKLSTDSLIQIYVNYKQNYFPMLLKDSAVSSEDKQKIRELLKKPWNLYIRRHSSLTQKSKFLKEHILRQHAGWSKLFNEKDLAHQLGISQPTVCRDIKILKDMSQKSVYDLAKSDLAYYFKRSINGIEEAKKKLGEED